MSLNSFPYKEKVVLVKCRSGWSEIVFLMNFERGGGVKSTRC